MSLILQLKEEHVQLIRLFEEVKSEISQGDIEPNILVEQLRDLKDILLAHLALEDKLIYPKLTSSDNKEAQNIGKKFSTEMAEISNVVLAFFGKYIIIDIQKLKSDKEFEKELTGIIEAVVKRVELEENTLFPAYEQYCGQKGA